MRKRVAVRRYHLALDSLENRDVPSVGVAAGLIPFLEQLPPAVLKEALAKHVSIVQSNRVAHPAALGGHHQHRQDAHHLAASKSKAGPPGPQGPQGPQALRAQSVRPVRRARPARRDRPERRRESSFPMLWRQAHHRQ